MDVVGGGGGGTEKDAWSKVVRVIEESQLKLLKLEEEGWVKAEIVRSGGGS